MLQIGAKIVMLFGMTSKSLLEAKAGRMYIYDDAASNWGHRDLMLDPSATGVGIGIDVVGKPGTEDYTVYNAIDLN